MLLSRGNYGRGARLSSRAVVVTNPRQESSWSECFSVKARSASPTGHSRGFSLIEVLVCVLIIGVLLALALPLTRQLRAAAWKTDSLTNLRTHSTAFAAYTSDYRGMFPNFAKPVVATGLGEFMIGGGPVQKAYFLQSEWWNAFLRATYYNGIPSNSKVFYPPDSPIRRQTSEYPDDVVGYPYACSFVARPEFWNAKTMTGPAQYGPTRVDEVAYPGRKILLSKRFTDDEMNDPAIRAKLIADVALVDGAAQTRALRLVQPGFVAHRMWDPPRSMTLLHSPDDPAGGHTIDGIRGRDIE